MSAKFVEKMEIVVPIHQNMDFDFNSARSSPMHHSSSPRTPKAFGDVYCSAPASPSRLSQFYREFDEFLRINENISNGEGSYSEAAVPFDWEEKPGTPKSPKAAATKHDDDFAFHVGLDDLETASLSAEELFDGGVIKPFKPPPGLQLPSAARISGSSSINLSPTSPASASQRKKIVLGFSPRYKRESSTPFSHSPKTTGQRSPRADRGRERAPAGMKSSSRRGTRSLSPLRVSRYPWEQEEQSSQQQNRSESSIIAKSASNFASSALASFSKGYKRWKFKDFFLFRSASEGRAADKDPLKKYTAAVRRREDVRTSSMRSIDSPSGLVPSRRRSPVSAHELHYTVNKAVSEDLKKKTFLPYKQGILGRLAFNPAVHALANGFGLSHK